MQEKRKSDDNLKQPIPKKLKNNIASITSQINYTNGDKYIGDIEDDCPHGKGKMTFANNEIMSYDGDWINGNKHGYGSYIYTNGAIYNGNFSNDVLDGEGTLVYKNTNDTYFGSFKNNRFHGKGTFIDKNGEYNGDFQDDKKHGVGTMKYNSGDIKIYSGQWNSNKRTGKAFIMFSNGDIYCGNVKQGSKSGYGEYISFDTKTSLSGQWANDRYISQK
jgi:hypothetical protein